MNSVKLNEDFHLYLSVGYLISLIIFIVMGTLEYASIKNNLDKLNSKQETILDKHFSDLTRLEHIVQENTKSRSKQLLFIKKYLSTCNPNKVALNKLYEDIEDLELEINTLR